MKLRRTNEWTSDPRPFLDLYYFDMPEGELGIFHVTPRINKIVDSRSLKPRSQTGLAFLGGGSLDIDPHLISTTYDLDRAKILAEEFAFAARIVQGKVTVREAVQRVLNLCDFKNRYIEEELYQCILFSLDSNKFDYVDEKLGELIPTKNVISIDPYGEVELEPIFDEFTIAEVVAQEHYCNFCRKIFGGIDIEEFLDFSIPCVVYDAYRKVEQIASDIEGLLIDEFGYNDEALPNMCFPGFTSDFSAISDIQEKNVGIVVLEAREDAKPVIIPEEMELRFKPDDLRIDRTITRKP